MTALAGDFANAVGFRLVAFTGGPMQMLYACENVKTVTRFARVLFVQVALLAVTDAAVK